MKLSVDGYTRYSGKDSIPKHYGYSYSDFCRDADIYYPLPINYIVRYWRGAYWAVLRSLYWIGLIDTRANEEFSWGDFFRIKTY